MISPTLAAYYAMKAIKDCGIELKKNVRLILGLMRKPSGKV